MGKARPLQTTPRTLKAAYSEAKALSNAARLIKKDMIGQLHDFLRRKGKLVG